MSRNALGPLAPMALSTRAGPAASAPPPATVPRTTRDPRILTVFGQPEHRRTVHRTCADEAPGSSVADAATATDAVLMLLAGDVDLVLVDVPWSGELLQALERHVRRSAPHAGVLRFGAGGQHGPTGGTAASTVHPWTALAPLLGAWLRRWRAQGPD